MRRLWVAWTAIVILPGGMAFTVQADDCRRPGDFDGDGEVGLADHAVFAACLSGAGVAIPPPGCDAADFAAADQDDDTDVDLADFALLSPRFGETSFGYGPHRDNLEAETLAMAVSGQLRAPDAEYERIAGDLALIRAAYPELVTVVDDADYVPNQLIVGISVSSPAYAALNEYYFVVDEEIHGTWRVLTFCDNLNAPLLAAEYASLPEVNWAEPNWMIGIDDYITVTPLGGTYRYEIDDGFWDCFDGCDCHRLWVLDVDAEGSVSLISYAEQGWPHCEFAE